MRYLSSDLDSSNLSSGSIYLNTCYLFQEWLTVQEEAKKRDHRVVGLHQELFFFHPLR